MGRLPAELVEAVQVQVQAELCGYGRDMENGIGGPTDGHVHPDGVVQRGGGDYLPGGDILLHQLHDLHAGELAQAHLPGIHGMGGGAAGKAQSHGLGEAGHGVGGKEAGAGSRTGTGHLLQVGQSLASPLPALEDIDQIQLLVAGKSRHHGPAGDHDGGQVQPPSGHDVSGDDLVAGGYEHQSVQLMGLGHDLYGVLDQLATGQGVSHSSMPHGHAVAHADGLKLEGNSPRGAYACLYRLAQLVQMDVSGDKFIIRVYDADEWPAELFIA